MTKAKIAINNDDFNEMIAAIDWRLKDVAAAMGYDVSTPAGATSGYSYLRRLRTQPNAKIDREKLKSLIRSIRKEIRDTEDDERKALLEQYRYLGGTVEKIALVKPQHRKDNISLDPAALSMIRAMGVMSQEEMGLVMQYKSGSKISAVENAGGKFPPYRVKALADHLGIEYEKFVSIMTNAG